MVAVLMGLFFEPLYGHLTCPQFVPRFFSGENFYHGSLCKRKLACGPLYINAELPIGHAQYLNAYSFVKSGLYSAFSCASVPFYFYYAALLADVHLGYSHITSFLSECKITIYLLSLQYLKIMIF